MKKNKKAGVRADSGLADHLPAFPTSIGEPEGAVMSGDTPEEGRIAVIYNRGETPPKITVLQGADEVQTVLADGVAVAVVAQAGGPGITAKDILLVERCV